MQVPVVQRWGQCKIRIFFVFLKSWNHEGADKPRFSSRLDGVSRKSAKNGQNLDRQNFLDGALNRGVVILAITAFAKSVVWKVHIINFWNDAILSYSTYFFLRKIQIFHAKNPKILLRQGVPLPRKKVTVFQSLRGFKKLQKLEIPGLTEPSASFSRRNPDFVLRSMRAPYVQRWNWVRNMWASYV